MTEVTTVKPHLERRFQDQRVIACQASAGESAAKADSHHLTGLSMGPFRLTEPRGGRYAVFAALRGALVQTLNDGKCIIL